MRNQQHSSLITLHNFGTHIHPRIYKIQTVNIYGHKEPSPMPLKLVLATISCCTFIIFLLPETVKLQGLHQFINQTYDHVFTIT